MALGVDLVALDADGKPIWAWVARRWDGHVVAREAALPAGEWPQSWSGPVSVDQVRRLRDLFGGKSVEMEFARPDEDLDALLQQPRAALLLVVEEWGST